MSDNQTPNESSSPARTAYQPPRLVVYGTLSELTHNVGRTAALDGGKGAKARSNP
jgi:hypothetical protein